MLRPIEWSRIVSVTVDGQPVDATQAQDVLRRLAKGSGRRVGLDERYQSSSENLPEHVSYADLAREALTVQRPTASLRAHVEVANWDSDAATDGLALWIQPVDELGQPVVTRGVLTVELQVPPSDFDGMTHGRGERLRRVQRWTVRISEEDLAGGCRLALPWRGEAPVDHATVVPSGLVQIRFVVPGEGTFEAQQDGVRLRKFAPLQHQGYRPASF